MELSGRGSSKESETILAVGKRLWGTQSSQSIEDGRRSSEKTSRRGKVSGAGHKGGGGGLLRHSGSQLSFKRKEEGEKKKKKKKKKNGRVRQMGDFEGGMLEGGDSG